MKSDYLERKTCRLCDSNDLELVIPLEEIALTEKYLTKENLDTPSKTYPIDVYMCLNCSHVQIIHIIDPEILWDDFTFRSGQAAMIIDHLNDVANKTSKKYNFLKKSLIIDVGSNDGTLLKSFKNLGMEVLGIDPAKEIAAEANNAGIPTIPEFLTKSLADSIIHEKGKAKLVACFNAFAHSDNMDELMASICSLVASNGIFIFEVSYLVDIIDNILLGTIIHEHLCHHSVKPLARFLNKHGMELIDVERVPYQGGSLIGLAQHIGGPHEVMTSVPELIDYEKNRGFDLPETINSFSKKLDKVVLEFHELLSNLENQGNSIAGYGAARSNPTLFAQFKIGDKISFIVDDHPQKVNKYTPGEKIRVLPTKELLNYMPNYTIILAWEHADAIIRKSSDYLNKGGHFITLLPEINIISADDMMQ